MDEKFDVTGTIENFMAGNIPERQLLVKKFSRSFNESRALKIFLAEVCDESSKQGQRPIQAMAMAMMYGMTIGVIMERERTGRKRIQLA
jgi:hypothetical protein